jgi:hypothetical protein
MNSKEVMSKEGEVVVGLNVMMYLSHVEPPLCSAVPFLKCGNVCCTKNLHSIFVESVPHDWPSSCAHAVALKKEHMHYITNVFAYFYIFSQDVWVQNLKAPE